jgi:hypothetical protein
MDDRVDARIRHHAGQNRIADIAPDEFTREGSGRLDRVDADDAVEVRR